MSLGDLNSTLTMKVNSKLMSLRIYTCCIIVILVLLYFVLKRGLAMLCCPGSPSNSQSCLSLQNSVSTSESITTSSTCDINPHGKQHLWAIWVLKLDLYLWKVREWVCTLANGSPKFYSEPLIFTHITVTPRAKVSHATFQNGTKKPSLSSFLFYLVNKRRFRPEAVAE